VPNDELWDTLWGMERVEAPAAWDITTGSGSNVVVCVIDTGACHITSSRVYTIKCVGIYCVIGIMLA
jgi:hypothetical protein